jgi:hypothetical protein
VRACPASGATDTEVSGGGAEASRIAAAWTLLIWGKRPNLGHFLLRQLDPSSRLVRSFLWGHGAHSAHGAQNIEIVGHGSVPAAREVGTGRVQLSLPTPPQPLVEFRER